MLYDLEAEAEAVIYAAGICTATGIHIMAVFPMIRLLLALIGMVNVKLYLLCTLVSFLIFAALYIIIYSLTAKTYYKIVRR